MFERFDDDARRVVVLAQEEARLLDHNSIGTEHLLLAMVRHGEGIAGQALRWFEITLPAARAAVVDIVGRGGTPPSGHIPFTHRAKTVLEHSLREALRLDDGHIGAQHLLLALALEGDGVGCEVFTRLRAAPDAVAAKVLELRKAAGPDDAPKRAVAHGLSQQAVLATRSVGGPFGGPPPEPRCAICGRSEQRVARFLVARGVSICDRCARDAVAQLDELPDDAPKRVRFRPRETAPPDEREAVAAIGRAFEAVIGPLHVPPREALWAVEGGAALEPVLVMLDAASARAPVVVNDVTVERVRFVDETEAEVGLGIWMAGQIDPMVQPAHAILEDGTWKVSRSTVEHYARQAQQFARPPD
jgi:Clp amino terminal domain, pathogenicity island component/ClpX C4-type zinc finger